MSDKRKAISITTANGSPLTDLQGRILAHCIASSGVDSKCCAVTPCGIIASDRASARAVYGALVYEYGIMIFTAYLQNKISKRKYDLIADFVDSFATAIEYSIGMKKGGLAIPIKITISD